MRRLLAISVVLIMGAPPLRANWGGEAGGSVATGGFKAFGTTQVEMQSENLLIQLYRDRAKVQVDYVLRNTGEAVDVRAGFPCLSMSSKSTRLLEVEDYQLMAGGRVVPYHIEQGSLGNWKTLFDPDFAKIAEGAWLSEKDEENNQPSQQTLWWLVSTVRFEKGETKNVTIRYESLYEESSSYVSDDATENDDYFRYLLSTGAAWKGPIEKGKVTIRAVTIDPKSIFIKPRNRFHEAAGGFVWEFSDLKPTAEDNIEVCLNDKFNTIFNYALNNSDDRGNASWYSFEGNKYYFDFHGYAAVASSEKAGYPAKAVGDFDPTTAWVAGRNGGINESLTLQLTTPEHVDQIGLIPGFAKSKALYYANNRVQEIEVLVNGQHQVTATLPDEYISFGPNTKKGYELIDLGAYTGKAQTITLRVKKIYPGTKYDDTCISEVLLRKRLKTKPEVQGAR
jgi:hypothetical protein